MPMYYRRSWLARILAFLIAVPVVAYLAKLTYEWLWPLLPLFGAVALGIIFYWVGFRRRY